MSDLSEAFTELLDANDAVCGVPQTVLIGADEYRAIIEEISFDEAAIVGGSAEKGGYRIMVALADLNARPTQGDNVTARGNELEVLDVTERNGVTYEITAGSLVSDA